jgi:predicted kinase
MVAEVLAAEQLAVGRPVVVDAVNDVEPARDQWRGLAAHAGVPLVFVEVRCSDPAEHRRRLAVRRRNIPGFPEPTWESLESRRSGFAEWAEPRLVLDSMRSRAGNLAEALAHLAASAGQSGQPEA